MPRLPSVLSHYLGVWDACNQAADRLGDLGVRRRQP